MRSLASKLYLFCFFDDFVLIYPLYAVLFAENGLSVGQISVLFGVWSISGLLLSVPTGVLADRTSRRGVIIAGQLIRAVGYLLWILEPTFWGFLAGFVLWGTSGALVEGAFEALAYDELDALGRRSEYVKLIGRCESASLIAVVAASLVAAVAIELGYDFVLGASAAAVLLAGAFVVLLPESPRHARVHEEHFLGTLRDGLRLAFGSREVLGVILFAGFIGAIWGSLDEYWSLYLDQLDFSRTEISIGVAAFSAAGAAGTLVAHRFEHVGNVAFVALMAALGALLAAAVGIDSAISTLLIAAFMFGFCLIYLVLGGRLQHAIEERTRATVTSVAGFAMELMGLGIFAVVGVLAGAHGVEGGLLAVAAIILLVALVGLLTISRREAGRRAARRRREDPRPARRRGPSRRRGGRSHPRRPPRTR